MPTCLILHMWNEKSVICDYFSPYNFILEITAPLFS